MNKILHSYVNMLWTEIIYVRSSILCSPLDRRPLSAFDSIDTLFSVSKKKHRHNKSSFIMPRARNGRRSGRIRVDERVVDDESPIIGANIAVDQAHVVGIV